MKTTGKCFTFLSLLVIVYYFLIYSNLGYSIGSIPLIGILFTVISFYIGVIFSIVSHNMFLNEFLKKIANLKYIKFLNKFFFIAFFIVILGLVSLVIGGVFINGEYLNILIRLFSKSFGLILFLIFGLFVFSIFFTPGIFGYHGNYFQSKKLSLASLRINLLVILVSFIIVFISLKLSPTFCSYHGEDVNCSGNFGLYFEGIRILIILGAYSGGLIWIIVLAIEMLFAQVGYRLMEFCLKKNKVYKVKDG